VWHSFYNQYAKIYAHCRFCTSHKFKYMPPICSSPQYSQLACRHFKKKSLQWNLEFGSTFLRHLSSTKACFWKWQHIWNTHISST
jgi:hypothetical protein